MPEVLTTMQPEEKKTEPINPDPSMGVKPPEVPEISPSSTTPDATKPQPTTPAEIAKINAAPAPEPPQTPHKDPWEPGDKNVQHYSTPDYTKDNKGDENFAPLPHNVIPTAQSNDPWKTPTGGVETQSTQPDQSLNEQMSDQVNKIPRQDIFNRILRALAGPKNKN